MVSQKGSQRFQKLTVVHEQESFKREKQTNKVPLKEGKEGRKEGRTRGRYARELFTANSLGSQSRE